MDLFQPINDLFGGGSLTPILVVGGLVALYLAFKLVKLVMKFVALAVAAVLFLGTAPLASNEVSGPAAACAQAGVEHALGTWQSLSTKQITVEALSDDAACAEGGVGLATGTAELKLRTFYDLPTQTWSVTPAGASAERLG